MLIEDANELTQQEWIVCSDATVQGPAGKTSDNQDRALAFIDSSGVAHLVVADGIGGADRGESGGIAAEKTCAVIQNVTGTPSQRLKEAGLAIKAALLNHPQGWTQMDCVASYVQLHPDGSGTIAHTGDTRVYTMSEPVLGSFELTPLTIDHVFRTPEGQPLDLQEGRVTSTVAHNEHPNEPAFSMEEGSWLLICSDGFYEALGRAAVGIRNQVFQEALLSRDPADYLVKTARYTWLGLDDTTVVLAGFHCYSRADLFAYLLKNKSTVLTSLIDRKRVYLDYEGFSEPALVQFIEEIGELILAVVLDGAEQKQVKYPSIGHLSDQLFVNNPDLEPAHQKALTALNAPEAPVLSTSPRASRNGFWTRLRSAFGL